MRISALTIFLFITILLSAQGNKYVQTNLISEVSTISPGEKFLVGVYLKMEKDWHTYWKNPGDEGLETKIKISLEISGSGFEYQVLLFKNNRTCL